MNKLCFLPDLFVGLGATCGGSVLGIVSPGLPDDPDVPSTRLSVNG